MSDCRHPLVVDTKDQDGGFMRECVECGLRYDRSAVLAALERAIRERHRLPPSPWTAWERSMDTA